MIDINKDNLPDAIISALKRFNFKDENNETGSVYIYFLKEISDEKDKFNDSNYVFEKEPSVKLSAGYKHDWFGT
ncbi:MAG: hypothetical protein M1365_04735, partial [Actinobacteria bacterium]|nr:hypothetical protein [Actinomycetota bacterium]